MCREEFKNIVYDYWEHGWVSEYEFCNNLVATVTAASTLFFKNTW
jgi:hypothetical protein